ncbi:Endoplasmic reticulum aminopeptidase 2 [Eumeta japonica]|uniref:glutamyl aminopeptidase n=1 Tax=Eumeta variegata TaxID=151549 RepID=A0A4C2A3V5_EUMVA|nr:Endoplasmic reticulum aminopeptidase 2 [Eumeta japonica]
MEKPSAEISERLSKSVIPQNYKIILNPDLEAGTFSGNVNIRVDIKDERDHIRLHTKFLQIQNVKNITPGIYDIDIGFTGILTNKFIGFYASRFKKGVMAASKFQPTYAREAFPCFDEPEYKATFDITLVKPHSFIALSNMNEISAVHNEINNVDEVTFATSVPMSTYLACFVICDFHYLEKNINSNGIGNDFKLRTFAQRDQLHKIKFALDIAQRATEFYITYYQIPFPLPKLDMIAIPDYVSGATEHWGLITYRETSFLIDEKTASTINKRNVAETIAHELAHMWFGNLVTMKWWDDLWLNEGFASYMQFKALNAVEPSWTMGASVLRMFEGILGEENFRNGIKDYLKKYQFGVTVTKDLLDSLDPYFIEKNPGLSIRVNYPHEMWLDLIMQLQLKSDKLTISDRAHLLNDVFALAEAQVLSYNLALELTTYLKVEDQYVPWATAASIFGKLKNKLLNSVAHKYLMEYVQGLITPIYEKQTWEKNTERTVIEGLTRSTVLTIATKYGVPNAQQNVRKLFLDWLNNYESDGADVVEPDLRDLVYYYGMKSGTIEEWEHLWQIYLKEEDVQERAKLRHALAAPNDARILAKYLTLAWEEKYIRSQDYLIVLDYLAQSPIGAALVWDDVRTRWPQYIERFSLNSRYLGNMIPAITADFNSENRLQEMETFFAKYPEAGAGEAARRRALENVRLNILWTEQHEKLVASWLEQHAN